RQKEVTDSAETTHRSSLKLEYMDEYQNGAENMYFEVRKKETSKKKRRLSAKKRKCRRRLVFAIITDIELVAIYTCRLRPCFSFSDPVLPVSIFTVVVTTTACHHTGHLSLFQSLSLFLCKVDKAEELDGGGDNKTVVWLEDFGALMVTGLRWRRKKTIMTSRLS
ncbi:hypothetical protein IGI04_029820, partial [Brassica rapa subsp. trilocularis]